MDITNLTVHELKDKIDIVNTICYKEKAVGNIKYIFEYKIMCT